VEAMSIQIEVQNIGGFTSRKQFTGIKQGLNRVRAPNALGKTSFIKALELLTLSEHELSGKGHYSNLYVGSEEPIVVRLSGKIEHERKFRRIGNKDLHLVEGKPLLGYEGDRVLRACFAVPGNPLIDDVLNGKSIRDYVKIFAGSGDYDKLTNALSEIKDNITAKLQHYREALIRLEEAQKLKDETEKALDEQRKKLAKLPVLNDEEIFEDYGLYSKKLQELNAKREEIAGIRSNNAELEEQILALREEIKDLETRINLIRKKNPRIEARLDEIGKSLPARREEFNKIRIQKAKAEDKLGSAQKSEILMKKYGENVCYACGKKMTNAELEAWLSKVRAEIDDLNEAQKTVTRQLDDLSDEQTRLQRDLEELGKAQNNLIKRQKSLANRENETRQIRESLKSLDEETNDLMKEISELSKSETAYKDFEKRQELLVGLQQREADITRLEERTERLEKDTLGVEEFQGKYEFVEESSRYFEARKNQIEEEIRKVFSKQVNDLYRQLGFADFEDIEIGPDFRVTVTRKKEGKLVPDFPLEALATSERITIAIALLLAAKQIYVKDFPFFVIDELITAYDPTRFKAIEDYLKHSQDYVIMTELSSQAKEVQIVHEA
jgi:septal ring factor EnvC (AmiA/AmiB activator)